VRNLFIAVLLCFLPLTVSAQLGKLDLVGQTKQGGLLIGTSNMDIASAKIGSVTVPIHENKRLLVFGFGRDADSRSVLTVNFVDGTTIERELTIERRVYDIDEVNGVASKYVSPPESVLKRIRNDTKNVKQAREKMTFRKDFLAPIIQPAQGRISGVYGSQRVFNGVPKRPHFGLDIAAPTGTEVIAPWDGVVVLSEPDMYYSGGTLIIDHGMGITTTYIHLSKLDVAVGDEVKQGNKIAEIGATGRVTGPHLDWRMNWFSRRLDPQLLFNPN
jgi:murein DD-endopeptidase MepM/ murein hydrolase activator NlpD